MEYIAPWWLPGGNAQTIWPALYGQSWQGDGAAPAYQRERWTTADNDFVDVDWLNPAGVDSALPRPLLVLFHGLEGSSASHYAHAFADFARSAGMRFAVPHFRGCSGELNWAPRAYHSGDYEEIGWMLAQLRARHTGPIIAVGVSLGGNALLRWAQEMGAQAGSLVQALAAVSAPLDLSVSGRAIGQGFNRWVYTRMFLNSMVPKALAKLAQHPGLFCRDALLAARDLYAFDNVFTAPLHGFKNTQEYWQRCSAKPHLQRIEVPTLVLNARNDPFLPAAALPLAKEVGTRVTLWQPAHGGHVGFAAGPFPGQVLHMPQAVGAWLAQHVGQEVQYGSDRETSDAKVA